jgi:hypothetical protein
MSFRNRLCLVTDIKGYSSHTTIEHEDAQLRLHRIMRFACWHASIFRVRAGDRQDRGDGRLFVLSPRIDETLAIPRLVLGLRHGLYLSNREPGAFGRIRLRAAMARGVIAKGRTGFLGQAPITACRLVDSDVLRKRLDGADEADLGFIVPDDLYQDVIRQDFPGLPSSQFTSEPIATKEYRGTGWIYLPPVGPALDGTAPEMMWATVAAGVAGGVLGWVVGTGNDPDNDEDALGDDYSSLFPESIHESDLDLDADTDDPDIDHDDAGHDADLDADDDFGDADLDADDFDDFLDLQ